MYICCSSTSGGGDETVPKDARITNAMLLKAFSPVNWHDSRSVLLRGVIYEQWWPKLSLSKPRSSPLTFISDKQRLELLHRSAPLAAVVQKSGHKLLRAYVIDTGLIDASGELVGMLLTFLHLIFVYLLYIFNVPTFLFN